MARSAKAVVAKTTGTQVALIDQELANAAAALKSQIGEASGNKIKIEATGDFILPDGSNLGNEIKVVIVDFATRHTFYSTPYNPQNPAPPDCYAMGRDIAELVPEKDSPSIQNEKCATCALNAYGSGANGKSKACKNERKLAVLLVDDNDPDAHNAPDAPLYELSLSPTNLKSFTAIAAHVGRMLNGPPVKAIVTVIGKNVGTYASVTFTDPVSNPDYAAHWARRSECEDILFRRPDFAGAAARQAAAPRRGAPPPRRGAAAARR